MAGEIGFVSATLLVLVLLDLTHFASADADQLQDFCIPDTGLGPGPVDLARLATYPCKNPATATAGDFVFSGVRNPGNFSAGFAGVSVTPAQFPGLNTLGMSFVRADFEPGGVNPPHYHPRATETALVVEGEVYSGFVDTGGRVFAAVIKKGEVMVFPRGMVHFQMNVGESPATLFGSFNGQNPGLVRIPATVFGSGIKEELLEKAFGLSREEVERLKRKLGPKAEHS